MCRNLVPPIAPRREQWLMTAQAGSASSILNAFNTERRRLREQARAKRKALSFSQQRAAAKQLSILFDRYRLLKPRMRLAVYLATPEELDLSPLIAHARKRYCELYIPHISNLRRRQMRMVVLPRNARLNRHRWGMQQLASPTRQAISVKKLDIVLVPTVAFDQHGHRLGMGAGFYDRHFASLQHIRWRRPRLIGIAHSVQQVDVIPKTEHDIQLMQVMTERELIHCR